MRAWAVLLIVPWVVLAFPWAVALMRGRRTEAAGLATLWAAGWACAVWLWFGPGMAVVLGLGLAVVFTTTIELD
jgi:hypothetical protein